MRRELRLRVTVPVLLKAMALNRVKVLVGVNPLEGMMTELAGAIQLAGVFLKPKLMWCSRETVDVQDKAWGVVLLWLVVMIHT